MTEEQIFGDWKPIKTAPKDGTWILVYGQGPDDDFQGERQIAVAQYTDYLNGVKGRYKRWQFAWFDGGYYGIFSKPTHWMQLPNAPKKKTQGTKK